MINTILVINNQSYKILSIIGEGTYGIVFKALWISKKIFVALKKSKLE